MEPQAEVVLEGGERHHIAPCMHVARSTPLDGFGQTHGKQNLAQHG
jgi:hypothetical protein